MSWVEALKKYKIETGKFSIPRKNTPEYEIVRRIQSEMAGQEYKPLSCSAVAILDDSKPVSIANDDVKKPVKRQTKSRKMIQQDEPNSVDVQQEILDAPVKKTRRTKKQMAAESVEIEAVVGEVEEIPQAKKTRGRPKKIVVE